MGPLSEVVAEWAEALATLPWPYETEVLGDAALVLRPAATEEQVARAEKRLGVRLPSSYRAFLLFSNGANVGVEGGERMALFAAEDVRWLRDVNPDWIRGWSQMSLGRSRTLAAPSAPCDVENWEAAADALLIAPQLDLLFDLLVPVPGGEDWEFWGAGKEGAAAHHSFADKLQSVVAILRRHNQRSGGTPV